MDIEGYRPKLGDTDRDGEEIEDRIYHQEEFDRNIVLDDRTKLVAKKNQRLSSRLRRPNAKKHYFLRRYRTRRPYATSVG